MNTSTSTNKDLKDKLDKAIDENLKKSCKTSDKKYNLCKETGKDLDDKSYALENPSKTNDFNDKLIAFATSVYNPKEMTIEEETTINELAKYLAEIGNIEITTIATDKRSKKGAKLLLREELVKSIKEMIDLIKTDSPESSENKVTTSPVNENTEVQKDEKLSEKDIDAYKKFMSMQKEALRVEAEQTEEVEAILIRLNKLATKQEYLDLISDFSPLTYNEKLGCKADEVLIIQDRAKTFLTGFLKKTPKEYGCFSKKILTSDKVQKFIIDRTKSEALENEISLSSNDESIVNDGQQNDVSTDLQLELSGSETILYINESSLPV